MLTPQAHVRVVAACGVFLLFSWSARRWWELLTSALDMSTGRLHRLERECRFVLACTMAIMCPFLQVYLIAKLGEIASRVPLFFSPTSPSRSTPLSRPLSLSPSRPLAPFPSLSLSPSSLLLAHVHTYIQTLTSPSLPPSPSHKHIRLSCFFHFPLSGVTLAAANTGSSDTVIKCQQKSRSCE